MQMNIIQCLLNAMLHFTPFGYVLCAVLLFARRRDGDKLRLILAINFSVWGLVLFLGLIYHYVAPVDTPLGYSVWSWLLMAVYLCPLFISSQYIPHKRTQSGIKIRWIRTFWIGIVLNTALYLIWIVTGSDVVRLMLLFSCLVYCLIVTYQELYLHPSILPESEPVQPAAKSPVRIACPVAASPLWSKLIVMLETKKVWSNPDLTLVELASMLGTNRTTLSNLIQENGYDGFYALINTYRVKEFLEIIDHQEISGIHETFFDVGFRSKSTAIRYFRQHTGTSPSEYLQRKMMNTN